MKRILGLDIGTNSIGWSLINNDFQNKNGKIIGLGSRIIPMSQDVLGKFDSGQSHSQTADRTSYRAIRRLYQRNNLRRERLHRVLNLLGFLPSHYKAAIDFEKKTGQFKPNIEVKVNYHLDENGKHQFLFINAYEEMVNEFKRKQPHLFFVKENGQESKIPYDWTIYYLRKKALVHKISKEELAWIILNFNQKRGYYQLRGDHIDEDKEKQFVSLKVKEVVDSGETVKGKPLYNVVFENGWPYDRQITKIEDWQGRTKEFIVTVSLLKNGDTKYSYKAIDSKKDWAAIKAKTEQDIGKSHKTVGEFIYDSLLQNPVQKVRGKLVKTIERKFYKEEFRKILSKQIELQPELFTSELYSSCVEHLYPKNEGHQRNIRDKGFEYLFTDDIIFYQRPLKSKKSTIGGCQYETRVYKKTNAETGKVETVKESIKAIPKSHPLFQEFRLWQWLQNLRIYEMAKKVEGETKLDFDVTDTLITSADDQTDLFDFLQIKQEVEQKHIIDYFVKKNLIDKKQKDNYRWNYVEDKKYPCCETRSQFISRLKKVKDIDAQDFLASKTKVGKKTGSHTLTREEQLWHIIYSVTDKIEYESALEKFAQKHLIGDKRSFVEMFRKFPPFKSDFGSYSHKAINKLLPLMRLGKYWDENLIDSETLDRIYKLLDGEFDEKINQRVREKTIQLNKVTDFQGLPLWLACYTVYGRHAETGDIRCWTQPNDIDQYLNEFKQHSLRNPIVEQVVTETLRVVRDIWVHYGKSDKGFFDEIHVELGREMKNPAKARQSISNKIAENENTNHRIKGILKELMNDPDVEGDVKSYSPSQQEILKIYEDGVYQNPQTEYDQISEDEIEKIRKSSNPTRKEITRYKLWLEQGYVSPYTGAIIPLSKLFTTAYQIEHIIPQSRYFDNSFGNKVICESHVNQDKDNRTAYEYLKEKGGSIIDGHKLLTLETYETHVNRYFKNNRVKLKNLLSEDIPDGFINRQLNDSRYISKLVTGLLSNIVREEEEQEATSKNLTPVTGVITSKLKNDWGLNDKWNEIIAPRFERLNELTRSEKFGFLDNGINAFRIQVPDEISKGFNKKRIDHRHHALDALVIACIHRNHIQYLNALNNEKKKYELQPTLLIKNDNGHYTRTFQMPWKGFPSDAKSMLEQTIVSFKQNVRVINKTSNRTWQWVEIDGELKKKLIKQTKGANWAIRKSLHKDTVSGLFNIETPKGKIATTTRAPLTEIKNQKHLEKITDQRIREVILPNHLKNYLDEKDSPQFDRAFSEEGIEDLNNNIVVLNNGKKHQPIKRVKFYEVGSKFPVGENGNKTAKYVEAAKGTNLFFAVYWDEEKKKRNFETVPLNEVIAHQKQVAHLPKFERTPIQPNTEKGKLLFTLSPNDLVYVPSAEEMDNPHSVDFGRLSPIQTKRIYKMEKASGQKCYFTSSNISMLIKQYDAKSKFGELGSQNKLETTMEINQSIRIKDYCWKLKIDRLGNIINVIR